MTIDEAIKHCEEVAEENDKFCKRYDDASGYTRSGNNKIRTSEAKRCEECAKKHRQLAEWLKDYKRLKEQEPKPMVEIDLYSVIKQKYIEREVLNKIRTEIKEWYWQSDKQALAKDPCVVDAMIDLFIRTINKYKAESEDKE